MAKPPMLLPKSNMFRLTVDNNGMQRGVLGARAPTLDELLLEKMQGKSERSTCAQASLVPLLHGRSQVEERRKAIVTGYSRQRHGSACW